MLEIKWELINVYRPNSAEEFKMKCVKEVASHFGSKVQKLRSLLDSL